jgi:anaphase-promoting complex subunit 2
MTLQNIPKFENMHFKLAEKMREQIVDRLLIPGVDSKTIINHYIQVIRVFKFIDPSTILLEIISKPIKDYLRSRKDTLRCIVSIIIEEGSELYSQLGNQYIKIPLKGRERDYRDEMMSPQASAHLHDKKQEPDRSDPLGYQDGYISSDEDEAAAEAWEPIPMNHASTGFESDLGLFISAKRKQSDIISTLVNIYGSQDAFIKVYKSMLDERLLQNTQVEYATELRNLELMKLRFGEQNLH